jgi:uncharacterized membrane protein YfcA
MDPRIALAGFIVGTITGATGIGGSSLLAPLLILVLGVSPTVAVGTDLVYGVPTKLLAAFVHARQKTVDRRLTGDLAIGGIPGSLAGLGVFAMLRSRIPTAALQPVMRHAIGIAILCACVAMVTMFVLKRRAAVRDAGAALEGARWRAVTIGFVVGALVAMTSIGAGSVTLPLLMLAVPALGARSLIGSEIAFAAIILPIAAAGHAGFGNVDWRITASLLAGSLPGVYLGSRLCLWLDDRPLRAIILAVLAYAAYRLL